MPRVDPLSSAGNLRISATVFAGLVVLLIVSSGAALADSPTDATIEPRSPDTVTNVTLVTGQTVSVAETDTKTQYVVDADVPMQQIRTEEGTYIFPEDVDFSRFERALFNVEYLISQNLTDAETETLPVIVTSTRRTPEWSTASDDIGLTPERELSSIGAISSSVPKHRAGSVAAQLRSARTVDKVYLDSKIDIELDDANKYVSAPAARSDYGVTGNGTTVAVLDTGVDESHPDIGAETEVVERDFTDEGTTDDNNGHGTHVAGIITGDGDASEGEYVGIAPDAKIMDLRVLNSQGAGKISGIIDAIAFATENDADVISMSLGGEAQSERTESLFTPAINDATESGSAVVVAAGNSGPEYGTVGSPGIVESAITVGASGVDGEEVADYSSRGPTPVGYYLKPDLIAPGSQITSAASSEAGYSESYVTFSGTSMATPVVSGAAALLVEHRDPTPEQLKSTLTSTADPLADGDVYRQGAGGLNASAALGTDIVVNDGTIDFGTFEDDITAAKTVTITNRGEQTRDILLNATATDIVDGTSRSVSTNVTSLQLAPDESQPINLTVDVTEPGIYSGELVINATSNKRVIFGYARASSLTVNKEPLPGSDETVQGDQVVIKPHHDSDNVFGRERIEEVSLGSVSVEMFSSTVSVFSSGQSETDDTTIHTAETNVDLTEDTTVTLSEDATVSADTEIDELEAAVGPLTPYDVTSSVEKRVPTTTGSDTIALSRTSSVDSIQKIRVTPDQGLNLSVSHLLVPEDASDSGSDTLDVSNVYHLAYTQPEVASEMTFKSTANDLATIETTYRRTGAGNSYQVAPVARATSWESTGILTQMHPIRDRTSQTIHVPTQGIEHAVTAGTDPNALQRWQLAPTDSSFISLSSQEAVSKSVNQHPFIGDPVKWSLADGEFTFETSFQVAQDGSLFDSNAENRIRVVVAGETVVETNTSAPAVGTAQPISVDPGDTVRVETVGNGDPLELSTITDTTYLATYNPGDDSTPPEITGIDIEGLNETNAVTGEATIDVRIDESGSGISAVEMYVSNGSVDSPFDGTADGWRQLDTAESDDDVYRFNLNETKGKVNLAVRAVDEADNEMQVVTTAAVRAAGSENKTISPVVGDNSPQDPDGDGKYEDVNGDGSVDVVDVQALFYNRKSDSVQNNINAFDFNDDGSVDVVDVQRLFYEQSS